jgi:hypothetical protein
MRVLVPSLLVLGFLLSCAKADDKENKRKPKFTIGKETTYVTGPVDADGYIDYAAALNERLSKGIKPDDNANVLLWKVFGPRPEGKKMPPEFFKWLGTPEPPESGDYFIGLTRFVREQLKVEPGEKVDEINAQMDRAVQRPWTAKAYPELAAWLKANEKPLALTVEASKRPLYYNPLVPTRTGNKSSGLIGALLPTVQKCRELANVLTARALLHIGEGRPDAAWQDLLVCHRLGRLVARGSTLIEALVGFAIDAIAAKADLVILDSTKLTAKQLRDCLRDLRQLPAMPALADKVNLAERFVFLEAVLMIDREGLRYLEALSGGETPKAPTAIMQRLQGKIDWDPALRNGNQWFDRLVAAMRLKDRNEREKKLAQLEDELKKLKKNTVDTLGQLRILLAKDTSKAVGKAIGDVLICLLIPALHKVQQSADRIEQVQANLQLAFALACYQRERGRYPKTLDALAGDYLPAVPQDLFSSKSLIYRPGENGYLLYSVGVNGKDEEGRSYDDDPPGDDLVVRMPLPKLRSK